MTSPPPIACSLSATELSARHAAMNDLAHTALLGAHTGNGRAVLRFAARPGVREHVEDIVAAESECCAFLTMHVGEERGQVVLRIGAPPGAEPVLDDLVSAFRGRPQVAS